MSAAVTDAGGSMRVTYVQYAGDFRQTFESFESGGKATYQGQRHSLDFVGKLAARCEQVSVICATSDERYDTILANGVRAIGAGLHPAYNDAELIPAVAATAPDRLIIKTPARHLIRWAAKRNIRMLVPLADSFPRKMFRDRLRNWLLARELNRPIVEWVGNHGLNSCLSLIDIGVRTEKIIPWDWPPAFTPHDRDARTRRPGPFKLIYVGTVSEQKGVGDLLDALAILRSRDMPVTATIYGRDRNGSMAAKAASLSLGDVATLAGPIANEDVVGAMGEADAVVVPSRHEYPEGLPLTIYEALSSRTPILASDHPMFRGALKNGQSAAIFRASDPEDLARAIRDLSDNTQLYQDLSRGGAAAWDALQLPVGATELVDRWLSEDRAWLKSHSVGSGQYDVRLAERRAALAGMGAVS